MMYEEQRSRDKLMSVDLDYPSDMIPGNHQGGGGDPGMRMSSMAPSRQAVPLPPQPQHGYDSVHPDKMGDLGGSMNRHSDGKTFHQNPYPTYPRTNNHVYESPQFA